MNPILQCYNNQALHESVALALEERLRAMHKCLLPIPIYKLIFSYFFSSYHRMLVSSIHPFYPQVNDVTAFFSPSEIKEQMQKEKDHRMVTGLSYGLLVFTSTFPYREGDTNLHCEAKLFVKFLMRCGAGNNPQLVYHMIDDRPEEGASLVFATHSPTFLKPELIPQFLCKAVQFGKIRLLKTIFAACQKASLTISQDFLNYLLKKAHQCRVEQEEYRNETHEWLPMTRSWRYAPYAEIGELLKYLGAQTTIQESSSKRKKSSQTPVVQATLDQYFNKRQRLDNGE